MMMYGFGHAGLGWVGLLLGAVFWAVIISLIIWLVMRMTFILAAGMPRPAGGPHGTFLPARPWQAACYVLASCTL